MDIETLLSFARRSDGVVFLSAHPDDVAFSLQETFSTFSRIGLSARLISIFTKTNYTLRNKTTKSIEAVSRLRRQEDRAFLAAVYPRCRYDSLGMLDAPLRKDTPTINPCRTRLATKYDFDLISTLALRLRRLIRTSSLLFCPVGIGDHIDHLVARAAILSASESLPRLKIVFYEDLPYAGELSHSEVAQYIHRLSFALERQLIPCFCRIANMRSRLDLCKRHYPSQTNNAVLNDIRRHLLRNARRPAERLWVVSEF